MVKHIIFWNLKEPERQQEVARLLRPKFDALLGVVDGLLAVEVGTPAFGADLVLYSEFGSFEALDGYQDHPDHLAIKAIVQSLVCGRTCCDYEI